MSDTFFNKNTKKIKAYVQGKPLEDVMREYCLVEIEKLASNENHFGMSEECKKAIISEIENTHYYPDGSGRELKKKIGEKHNLSPEKIVLGTGGEQLIWLLSMVLLNEGENIIIPKPTFDIYSMVANYLGAEIKSIPLTEEWEYNLDEMLNQIDDKTKLMWFTSPNNPTGNILSEKMLDRVIKKVPENIVVCLDEAYYEYASAFEGYPKNSIDFLKERKNIAILRTFSKAYALAGLRIGYMFTNEKIAEKMNALNLTFGVNRLANIAALEALKSDEYKNKIVEENKKQIEDLEKFFVSLKMNPVKSFANFLWVDTKKNSKEIFEELQKRGIIIRPGFLWGYDSYIRVSTGKPEQIEKFKKNFKEVI